MVAADTRSCGAKLQCRLAFFDMAAVAPTPDHGHL